jgi:viroplasmin and RNaseH domain-containing protein
MEKLIPLNNTSPELIETIFNNIITKNEDTQYIKNELGAKFAILYIIEKSILRNNYAIIKDEHLIQALQYIKSVKDTNKDFALDLHDENIMIRNTPVGPQLVLTDPLFGTSL